MNFIRTIPNARTESEKQKDGDFITFDLKQTASKHLYNSVDNINGRETKKNEEFTANEQINLYEINLIPTF